MNDQTISETTLFILLSLAHQPRHGYAIMHDVEVMSENRVHLGTGTLYGAIKRLLEQGWIERIDALEADGRGRKDYALTDAGRRALNAELARLDRVLQAARWHLNGQTS